MLRAGCLVLSLDVPGNFLGFLSGTNFAPIANAIGGPNMKPLASTPIIIGKKNHLNFAKK